MFGAKTHIALGQTFLLTTLLLAAVILGLVPDRQSALREGRAALAEAIAVSGSASVTRGHIQQLEATLGLIVERNDDVLSAAVRRVGGRTLVAIGDHDQHWHRGAGDYSTDSHVSVPIWSGGQQWGQVELRFRPLSAPGWLGLVQHPSTRLIAFLALSSFFVFFLYLRKMLQYLDPSQAVPPHVRSALDTLAEGLLVVDLADARRPSPGRRRTASPCRTRSRGRARCERESRSETT